MVVLKIWYTKINVQCEICFRQILSIVWYTLSIDIFLFHQWAEGILQIHDSWFWIEAEVYKTTIIPFKL